MRCQILFSGQNKKNSNLLSAELAKRLVKVKFVSCLFQFLKLTYCLIKNKMSKCTVVIAVTLFTLVGAVSGDSVTVSTDVGTIIGHKENISFNGAPLKVKSFLGIPFAEPPVGQLRFQKPTKKAAFLEPFIADTMAPMCLQNLGYLKYYNILPEYVYQKEDCLYLNVFLPDGNGVDNKNLTVMIWLHGGAFQFGSQNVYNAKAFVALNNVILVTINYRLSALGFLSTGESALPGNYGLWDQHMAIQWVHANIEAFGGDSTNIAIFGESAGGASAVYQTFYEGNLKLFKRIIAESGVPNSGWALSENPRLTFARFANRTGCVRASQSAIVECFRNLPFHVFINTITIQDQFPPVVDGEFLKLKPNDIITNKTSLASDILKVHGTFDVILGLNSAEGASTIELVEGIMRSNHVNYSLGYTKEMFEKFVISPVLLFVSVKQTETLVHAIMDRYVDWTCPSDTQRMREQSVEFMSDVLFNAGVINALNAHCSAQETGRRFFYVYDHTLSILPDRWFKGAGHTEELSLVLGFPQDLLNSMYSAWTFSNDPASELPEEEVALSRQIMEYWTNFAKTGYLTSYFITLTFSLAISNCVQINAVREWRKA